MNKVGGSYRPKSKECYYTFCIRNAYRKVQSSRVGKLKNAQIIGESVAWRGNGRPKVSVG